MTDESNMKPDGAPSPTPPPLPTPPVDRWATTKYPAAVLATIGVAFGYVLFRVWLSAAAPTDPRGSLPFPSFVEIGAITTLFVVFLITPKGREFLREQRWLVRGLAGVGVIALLFMVFLVAIEPTSNHNNADNTLKSMALTLHAYASNSEDGIFPPSAPYPGTHVVDLTVFQGRHQLEFVITYLYFDNPDVLYYEEHEAKARELLDANPVDWEAIARMGSKNFIYLPWGVSNTDDIELVLEAQNNFTSDEYRQDLVIEGHETFYRQGGPLDDELRRRGFPDYGHRPEFPILFARHTIPRRDGKHSISVATTDGQYGYTLVEGDTDYDLKRIIAIMDSVE